MKNIINKNKGELLTFFINTIILLIVFFIVGIIDNTIIKSDLESQIYPLFNNIKDYLNLYNFNFGLGDSFLGTLYYYLLSPFNILILFIKDYDILFLLIILLKSSLSSVFCYKYLKYQDKKTKTPYLIILSLFYGLSSYFISYNFIVQFLDVYMIFPLLLLGIDKVIKEKKYPLYVITLFITIIFNYYFAYMVSIFIFLYYNYRVFLNRTNKKDYFKNICFFTLISFLTCLSTSFILLPIASEISNYSRNNPNLFAGENLKILFNLEEIINYYILGNFTKLHMLNHKNFLIFTSLISVPLIYFYFINNNINKKEKILTGIFFLIFISSISINYLNYIWHGLTEPCCFNGRFTFLFILFTILICFESLSNIKHINKKEYIKIFTIIYSLISLFIIMRYPRFIDLKIIIFFLIIYSSVIYLFLKIKDSNHKLKIYLIMYLLIISTSLVLLILNIIELSYLFRLLLIPICIYLLSLIFKNKNVKFKHFLILFLVLIFIYSTILIYLNRINFGYNNILRLFILLALLTTLYYSTKNKKIKYIFCLLIILEITLNTYSNLYRLTYKNNIDTSYEEVINYIKSLDKSSFYRIEDNNETTLNNPILYNYNGIDYFMSTIKEDFINFFIDLDVLRIEDEKNSISYDGSYHLLSSLLNVKYYVEHNNNSNPYYSKINTIDKYKIYENKNSLSLGYLISNKIKDLEKSNNGLDYINNIYKVMTNNDKDLLTKINLIKTDELIYTFKNTSNKDLYMLIKVDKDNYKTYNTYINNIKINGEEITYTKIDSIFRIPNTYKETDITIELNKNIKPYIEEIYLYYYDDSIYKEDINILKENQLENIEVFKNGLKGQINVKEDNTLFLSILYNKDLNIYVDGVKQDKIKLLNTFIGIDLTKGQHEIKVVYESNILYISLIPNLISISSLLLIYIKSRKERQ